MLMNKTYFYLSTISSVSSKQDPKYPPYWSLCCGLSTHLSTEMGSLQERITSTRYLYSSRPFRFNIHYAQYRCETYRVKQTLQRYKELQDIIAIGRIIRRGSLNCSKSTKMERFLSQPF
uniref:Uncharacterized protein n=1 Tax=Salix viminalis TaxID=40686 RepID=A0A6N2NLG8_SALVM